MSHRDVEAWQSVCSRCGRNGAYPPIIGDPEKFRSVSALWLGINGWCLEIESLIGSKLSPSACGGEFEGRTAEAVAAIQEEVREAMRCLPAASKELDTIFTHHARELEVLQQRASQALQRARLAREAFDRAGSQVAIHNRQVSYLERQLAALSSSCEPGSLDVVQATRSLDRERSALRVQTQMADEALGELETVCIHETLQLRSEEESLNRHTARALTSVPLGSLRDPRWWQKLADWLVDLVLHNPRIAWQLLQAIIGGPFGQLLWKLRNFLQEFLKFLEVLTFVVVVVSLFFPKAAALLPFLKKLQIYVALANLLIEGTFYLANGGKDPYGNPISLLSMTLGALSVLKVTGGGRELLNPKSTKGKVVSLVSDVIFKGASHGVKILKEILDSRQDSFASPTDMGSPSDSWTSCEMRIPEPSGTGDAAASGDPGHVGGDSNSSNFQTVSPPTVEFEFSHLVAPGEGLWNVAQRYYGDGTLWPEIAVANGIDPAKWQQDYQNNIHPGQTITVPVIEILIPEIWEVPPDAPHARVEDLVGV
jgi:hypothetical protein